MANVSRTYSKATFPTPPKSHGTSFMAETLASGNAVGIILYNMLIPALDRVTMQKCKENCSIAFTQILIALKSYKQKTGELPDSLDELVPDYLDAVPLDDFDGKPMRCSKEKKVIYSIGADLVDNGGADKTGWADDDPTVKIDF